MNCPSCQQPLPDDAVFCGHCGSALASDQTCRSCGRSNPFEMRFCLGCGARLGEPLAPPERTPRDYTPRHLADKILRSKSALEGERKQVTVLFADVKGSLELAQPSTLNTLKCLQCENEATIIAVMGIAVLTGNRLRE